MSGSTSHTSQIKSDKKSLEKSESSPPINALDSSKMVSSAKLFHSEDKEYRKEHHHSGGSDSQESSTASKLSKIGKRLRDSCRNFRVKNNSSNGTAASHNPEDYTSLQAPNESLRSKNFAPMDFSGNSGRIIDHRDMDNGLCSTERPQGKDSCAYFRRKIDTTKVGHLLTETQAHVHLNQPWFHKGVGRPVAQKILTSHGIDGLFLVRDSSVAGGFVISYFFSGKTYHTQVVPIVTPDDKVTYSLDNGRTRFFDLLQMVEYYQLNRGSLNHPLTHYVVSKTIGHLSGGSTNGRRPDSPAARSDSSSCHGTSDGSIDSQTSSQPLNGASDVVMAKIDSNHNNSFGSFSQDQVSEASTMSLGDHSAATAVESQADDCPAADDEDITSDAIPQ